MKVNKSEKFHDIIKKFIKKYDELKFYIITEIYLYMTKSEFKKIKTTIDENNDNQEIIRFISNNDTSDREIIITNPQTRKNESEKEKEEKIIENEDNYEYKTFEELNLYNNIEIHFITRYTRNEKEDEKVKNEKKKFEDNGPKMDNKQYLIFNF